MLRGQPCIVTGMIATLLHLGAAGGLGATAGLLGGLFGIGGGVVAIPLLGLIYHFDQQTAQGTTLVMVVPNVLYGFWRYWRRVGLDLRIAGTLAATAVVATYPAARRRPLAWGWSALVGIAGGIVSGFFGVGGAFIVPPLLTAFFGLRQIESQGLGLALVAPGTILALAAYAGAGQVDWTGARPLAFVGVLAISAGVAVAGKLPERRLRLGFAGLLATTALLLALHG